MQVENAEVLYRWKAKSRLKYYTGGSWVEYNAGGKGGGIIQVEGCME